MNLGQIKWGFFYMFDAHAQKKKMLMGKKLLATLILKFAHSISFRKLDTIKQIRKKDKKITFFFLVLWFKDIHRIKFSGFIYSFLFFRIHFLIFPSLSNIFSCFWHFFLLKDVLLIIKQITTFMTFVSRLRSSATTFSVACSSFHYLSGVNKTNKTHQVPCVKLSLKEQVWYLLHRHNFAVILGEFVGFL